MVAVSWTVPVTPPSNAYGTSTPWTLWPSVRVNWTWYWSSVMKLAEVGSLGVVVVPGSFIASWSVTWPGSLKTGLTSEFTFVLNVGVPSAPDAPSSDEMIRYDDP